MTTSNSRYQGKPLLRLLECYVLWVIDQLSEADTNTLREMTPKLQAVYRTQGNWQQVIASAVNFPSNMPNLIRDAWAANTEIARKSGVTLAPQQFAEMFVDQNLTS
jgi:hypothetical protein